MEQYFFGNFWMIFRMFLMFENGRGMFKFWKHWKILDLGVKIFLKNRISSKKIQDSPPRRQGAFDPISELTGLCRVHTFSTLVYFLPKST